MGAGAGTADAELLLRTSVAAPDRSEYWFVRAGEAALGSRVRTLDGVAAREVAWPPDCVAVRAGGSMMWVFGGALMPLDLSKSVETWRMISSVWMGDLLPVSGTAIAGLTGYRRDPLRFGRDSLDMGAGKSWSGDADAISKRQGEKLN
jgi:hypothetical protein